MQSFPDWRETTEIAPSSLRVSIASVPVWITIRLERDSFRSSEISCPSIGHKPGVPLDKCNLRAHCLEEISELDGDIPAADDDHARGRFPELQGGFVRQIGHLFDAPDRGNERPGPAYQKDGFTLEGFAVDLERMIAGKSRFAEMEIEVFRLLQRFFDMVVTMFHDAPHVFHDSCKIHSHNFSRNPELIRFPDLHNSIRRIDHELRGNSTEVQTGAAYRASLDQGDCLVMGKGIFEQICSCAGTDDDDIVLFHGSPFANRNEE